MRYAARVRKDEPGFSVSFPDVPEALTCGETKEEALFHARDAVETALQFYIEDRRGLPKPSPLKCGQHWITITSSTEAVLLLHTELIKQGISPKELAGRLGKSKQYVQRMLNLIQPPDIDNIANALAALGKRLELHII